MVYLGSGKGSDSFPENGRDNESNERDSDASPSSDEEHEGQIRIGRDFQVAIPDYIKEEDRRDDQCHDHALLLWKPCKSITSAKLDEFVQSAKSNFSYSAEQALGLLHWHKHDLKRASMELENFVPFPDEWSLSDKVMFEQGFQFHGKSFHRIRQMIPDKSISQLVKYYYSWKKTRTRSSLMDKHANKIRALKEGYDDKKSDEVSQTTKMLIEPEISSDEDSDQISPKCFNCGILCHATNETSKGDMCGTCYQHWNRTGNVRPTTGPTRKNGTKSINNKFYGKNSNSLPKGIYINHDDLVSIAAGPPQQGEVLLLALDRDIFSNKRIVQNNKQLLYVLHRRIQDKYNLDFVDEDCRLQASSAHLDAKWSNEELSLGVLGIRNYGKNFKLIADIIGTKTESHVRSFFVNFRRRYNLDAVLKEYDSENGNGSTVAGTSSQGNTSKCSTLPVPSLNEDDTIDDDE